MEQYQFETRGYHRGGEAEKNIWRKSVNYVYNILSFIQKDTYIFKHEMGRTNHIYGLI